MTTTEAPELYWDPYDIEIDADPHPIWKRMRDEQPVYRNEKCDFWALSRHDDIAAVHRDYATFTSSRGTVLELMGTDLGDRGSIIFKDPPIHTILRSLVSRAFTPRHMAAMEDTVRGICVDILDQHVGGPGFDYVQEFGAQLSSRVICALLGVPEEEREEKRALIDQTMHLEPGIGMVNDISLTAQIQMWEYIDSLAVEREVQPRDDLISVVSHAEITDDEGERRKLTRTEVVDFGSVLLGAGFETVVRLVGNAGVLLAEHPDQRADLARHPDAIPNAIEEMLRYEAPSPVNGRMTTRDVTMHGVTIPDDAKVLILTGSAGRDERVFPDPDRFDVRRQVGQHITFGFGIHFCLGAALARLEGRVALEETLKRWPEWGIDPDRTERAFTSTVRGYAHVGLVLP
jgi:cytochrome P450